MLCDDALNVIKPQDGERTLFYLDPPYAESDCGHYEKLKGVYYELLDILPSIEGRFLMSSYPSDQLMKLRKAQGYRSRDFEMALTAGKQSGKQTKVECLTWNYDIEDTMPLFDFEINN